MNNTTEILQELKSAAPLLASLNKTNVFSVPNHYFDDLAESILSKIKLSQNNHQADELAEIAPVLSNTGKQNVYTIPQNYFETFNVNIPPSAKIINIKKVKIFKYAVAAAAAGIIFASGFLLKQYNTKQNRLPANTAGTIKSISDDELNKYADEHNIQLNDDGLSNDDNELNIAAELKIVSNEELQQYCKSEYLKK